MSIRRSSHIVLLCLALLFAAGGTGYAAAKIDGRALKNASVAGKKLAPDTVTGDKVAESTLGQVPQAGHAATADLALEANTLGTLGPEAFARSSQFQVAGPFTTNPAGPLHDFFSFPELDLEIRTPRPPNSGFAGLVNVKHENAGIPLWVTVEDPYGSYGYVMGTSSSGINYVVNGPSTGDDFLRMTFFGPGSGVVVRLECVADAGETDVPVMCSALSYTP